MVEFAANLTKRKFAWTAWKALLASKGGIVQCDQDTDQYFIWFYDSYEVIFTSIWLNSVPQDLIDGGYSQNQNNADKTDFETNYKAKANQAIEPKTTDGRIKQAIGKGDSSRTNFYSHNWCDKTTWYEQAIRVVAETATDDGAHTVYSLAHANVIDIYHGKLTLEDTLKDASNNSYRVVVKVNNVTKTEQDPHTASGGDYVIDYLLGKITFLSALSGDDVVTATYHYATGSRFTMKPLAGKMLAMDMAECQFSADVVINDSVLFEVWGNVEAFAPQYLQSNGGPYPVGYKLLLQKFVYKGIQDFMNDSFRAYPTYPAIGGDSWRGAAQPTIVFDWDYLASTNIKASQGVELRCYLQHDAVFGGTFATVTFYSTSQPE